MKNPDALVFFLKYPQKGRIKTRLARDIGETHTLALYECFIRDLLDKLLTLDCTLHLFITPAHKVTAMKQWLGRDIPVHPQQGVDLGERMAAAFAAMFQKGYESCILMGSDFPDLPVTVPRNALHCLKSYEAVIAPAADGGYYLVGFQRDRFCGAVFQQMAWSTDSVFQQTMAIFLRQGVRVKALEQWWDVDDSQDLEALLERNMDRENEFRQSRTMGYLLKHKTAIFQHLRGQ